MRRILARQHSNHVRIHGPVDEPAGSTIVVTAAVMTTQFASANGSLTPMCSGDVCVSWWFDSRRCIRFSLGQREADVSVGQLLPVDGWQLRWGVSMHTPNVPLSQ